MLRPTREYKKSKPHRDARLFVIIAEGDREDQYFTYFNEINPRIRVAIVPRDGGKTAPKFFLERVDSFRKSGEWSADDKDELWFICDVDKWVRNQIDELFQICETEENWNLAISNPCFEVWLHHHSGGLPDNGESCGELKTLLPTKKAGQFNINAFCLLIEEAFENARNADKHPNHYFPERMQTKVYKLANNMLALLGENWK